MSLAISLIEQVVEEADRNGLAKVNEVEIEAGVLREVVPNMMHAAFEAVKEGTVAQEATLIITEIPAKAECRECQHTFHPERDNFLCPKCNKADVNVLEGDEIILKSMTCLDLNEGDGR